VVDALRRSMKVIHLEAVSTSEMDVKERVKSAQETNAFFKTVKSYLEKNPTWLKYEGYQLLNDGLLTYKGRLYIPNCDDLKRFIMDEVHKIPYTSNPSYQKMITATRKLFYWPRTKRDTIDYLVKCLECQQVKVEHQHPAGLLQTLPIPKWKWEIISMDFIIGLPKSTKHNESIMVVVDKLNEASHFIPVKSN
jgi:hypothetical protein